jgi:hypothetical protein
VSYPYGESTTNPIKGGVDSPQMAGALIIGALVFLILVRRGFRGVSAGGVSLGVR